MSGADGVVEVIVERRAHYYAIVLCWPGPVTADYPQRRYPYPLTTQYAALGHFAPGIRR